MNDRYKMKGRRKLVSTLVLALLSVLSVGLALAQRPGPGEERTLQVPLSTGFTYQGKLEQDGGLVSDDCTMAFRLYDDSGAGSQVGSAITATVPISDGFFTANLDFGGAAFTGDARWMGILVKCTGDGSFADLGRQELTAAPYALYALGAPWSGLTGVPAGLGEGTDHDHWGQSWSGTSGTGLTLSGGSTGLSGGGTSVGLYGTSPSRGVSGNSVSTVGGNYGVYGYANAVLGPTTSTGVGGESASTTGRGVYGSATATYGATYGVLGESDSTDGRGVHGYANAASGETYGVSGRSDSTGGRGVYGYTAATSGATHGVYGEADSPDGRGVYGHASATSGLAYGVLGESDSSIGRGVAGYGFFGVFGESDSTSGSGVFGSATAASGVTYGVQGKSDSNIGRGVAGYGVFGVFGESDSTSGSGVYGSATATNGETYGVLGESDSTGGRGVHGYTNATSGETYGVSGRSNSTGGRGVYGYASATSGTTYGVYGESDSPDGYGVRGYNDASSGDSTGVYGSSPVSPDGRGVYGVARYGVYGETWNSDGYGGYFVNSSSDGTALYAAGNGSGLDDATLRVNNTDTTAGVATYMTNDSSDATAHLYNAGNGDVLYLQNGGTDAGGTGGGYFIRAVNQPEGDTQFEVSSAGYVYADGGYRCGNSIDNAARPSVPIGFVTWALDENGIEPCLQDDSPADFAEMLPAIGSLEPGDVLAIGPDGNLTQSNEPFQTTVVGVYSFRPSFLGNAHFADEDGYVPLALLGVVPVKVSAENGSILPGDLLVASSTPGHAMKAGVNPPQGTVIGKALAPLTEGTGFIQILVTLQ